MCDRSCCSFLVGNDLLFPDGCEFVQSLLLYGVGFVKLYLGTLDGILSKTDFIQVSQQESGYFRALWSFAQDTCGWRFRLNKTDLLFVDKLVAWRSLVVIDLSFGRLLLFVSLHETLSFIFIIFRVRLFLLVFLHPGLDPAHSILKVGHLFLLSFELGVQAIDALVNGVHHY